MCFARIGSKLLSVSDHQKSAFLAPKMAKAIFWRKPVCLGPEWSVVGLPTIFSGCWTYRNVFCKVLEQVIDFFGAAITKKPHFLPQNGQKMPLFAQNSVFGA